MMASGEVLHHFLFQFSAATLSCFDRSDARMKQSEVNELMGKPRTFISKCELGERRVDFVELQLLAKIYRKNLSFFITID